MAAPVTLAVNATEAQALAYLTANFRNTYSNAAKTPYQGKNASQIYAVLKAASPSSTPYELAQATGDLLLSSALGSTVGAAATTAGAVAGDVATGVGSASFLPSWADGLANLLSALTSANTWIRVAKVVVGGTLLIVGLVHITGADNAVAAVAKKVPLPI